MSAPMSVASLAVTVTLAAAFVVLVPSPAAADTTECVVSDARLDWGVKESFRAYIDGSIANGEWTTDGDASYVTPSFTWSSGAGTLDPATGEGALEFTGSVRFTGHDSILDTTFADPRVTIDADGLVTLSLDVRGATMEGDVVDSADVRFVEGQRDVDASAADWTVTVATPTLTPDGHAAFPDYAEGEVFDPIVLTAPVDADCAAALAEAAAAEGLPSTVGIAAGGAIGLSAIAVLLLGLVRRRRFDA